MRKNTIKVAWPICAALALFLSGAAAVAQTITGSVRGTVTDPSGAVVAGATVTVTNTGTSVTTQTATDKSGLYSVEFLVLGNYSVTVSAPGFETSSVGPFAVQIDQVVPADVKLQVGRTSTTVKVAGEQALLLNTENSTISTSISANTLANMPMDGLNVQFATLFVPGAINPNSSAMGGIQGTERDAYTTHEGAPSDAQPSFNGNRQQSNSYILDGVDINETLQNAVGYNPSPFSIQELHVITGNADAEFGNVNGGQVAMVTKSGSNDLHGSAFEFYQSGGLDANTWANKYDGNIKPKYTQNQFGLAVGGPIFKNKLFFFANYIGMRHGETDELTATLPTSAMRGISGPVGPYDTASNCSPGQADFSAIDGPDDAYTTLWNTTVVGGYNNEVIYPNNCVPINPNNKLAAFLISHPSIYPTPNHPASAGYLLTNDYQGFSSSKTHNDQGDIRLDYTLNPSNTLMAKFSYGDAWDLPTQSAVEAVIPQSDDYPFTNAVLTWTHIFSSTIVDNARAGFTRITLNGDIPVDLSKDFGLTGNSTAGIGMPTGLTQTLAGFSYIQSVVGNGDVQNFGAEPAIQGFAVDNNFDYNDTLNWEHGKHIIKVGFDFLRYQQDYISTSDTGGLLGSFSYNGNATANWNGSYDPRNPNGYDGGFGFAEFLLNEASNAQITGLHGPFGQRQWRSAVFVQDDWKMMPNLTLNIGLRYGYDQPNYEVNNKMVNVNLDYAKGKPAGTPIDSMLMYAGQYNPVTGKTNSRALINPYRLGFMPRIGFAYKVTPRIVVRGGYGSTDDLESTGSSLRMTQNPQFQPSINNRSGGPGGLVNGVPTGVFTLGSGFSGSIAPGLGYMGNPLASTGGGAQYYAWDPNMRPAVIQQFNLSVQYQIDNHTSVQAGYVGQTGQHLAVPLWLDQFSADDTCQNMSPGPAQDTCYQGIDPYYALVGAQNQNNGEDYVGTGALKETVSRGISNYNSLQATLQRHQFNGLEFLVNYTFGKAMTNNPGYFGTDGFGDSDSYWQNVNNPRGDYGPSTFDARQSVTGTAVYLLPFGRGKQFGSNWNRLADEAFGGWQLSPNIQLNTGYPLTIHQNGNQCQNNCAMGTTGTQDYFGFANQYSKMKITGRGTVGGMFKWFGTDPSAQPCASRGTAPTNNPNCAYGRPKQDFGTAHVGTERGPGFQNYDLSLSKQFATIREESLKFRVDAFNAFNIASYGQPETYIGSNPTNFGQITGTASGPRKFQLSAIYQF
jgi:carboxypeptidase family protein/TonB-dependent receptor-like protein